MEVDCDNLLFGMELRIFFIPSFIFILAYLWFILKLFPFLSFLFEFVNVFILKYFGMP